MFSVSLEAEGLVEMMQTLKTIEQIAGGRHYTGVELNSYTRDPVSSADGRTLMQGGMTNADIMRWLAEQGRDFREPSGQEDNIATEFVKKSIESIPRKKVMKTYQGSQDAASLVKALAGALDRDVEKVARNLAAGGFRAAMKKYMEIVSENIDKGRFKGGGNPDLEDSYAVFKQIHAGFEKPIGKFSGQLIDNLNAKGPSARNIKPIRGKRK